MPRSLPVIPSRDPADICYCFVCVKSFNLGYSGYDDIIQHMYFNHKIVLFNKPRIPDMKLYMNHYRDLYLKNKDLDAFLKPMVLEVPGRNGEMTHVTIYLLGDFLPEDDKLRKELHQRKVAAAKKQQEKDLSQQLYRKHCFYCHNTFKTTRIQFIDHLEEHGFDLGRSTKMVYIEKLVNILEDLFKECCCIHCGMRFHNELQLEEHMNENDHKRINPDNAYFDQFYIINYQQYGKTWKDFLEERIKKQQEKVALKEGHHVEKEQEENGDADDPDWSNWGVEAVNLVCLFCPHVSHTWEGAILHLKALHNFDFKESVGTLNFYHQVKIINYIRHRISCNQCLICKDQFFKNETLLAHMEEKNHLTVPEKEIWDGPEYFRPVLEDDNFLIHLQDVDEGSEESEQCQNCASVDRVEMKAVAGCVELVPNDIATDEIHYDLPKRHYYAVAAGDLRSVLEYGHSQGILTAGGDFGLALTYRNVQNDETVISGNEVFVAGPSKESVDQVTDMMRGINGNPSSKATHTIYPVSQKSSAANLPLLAEHGVAYAESVKNGAPRKGPGVVYMVDGIIPPVYPVATNNGCTMDSPGAHQGQQHPQ